MALIKVGIHENLTFTEKTKINEHGTLEIGMAAVQDENAMMSAFEGNETFTAMESTLRIYPPSLKDYDQNPKSAADIASEVLTLRGQLLTYARLVATKAEADKAIGGLAMFNGLGIAPEQIKKALTMFNQEDFMKKVVTNLCTLFVKFLDSKKALGRTVLFRHKFLRQSKSKNFAVIPSSSFDVWVESMDVPKDASKIAYSEWEITNGKDNPDPVSSTAGDSTAADANKAKNLFNKPVETADAEAAPTAAKPDLFKTS